MFNGFLRKRRLRLLLGFWGFIEGLLKCTLFMLCWLLRKIQTIVLLNIIKTVRIYHSFISTLRTIYAPRMAALRRFFTNMRTTFLLWAWNSWTRNKMAFSHQIIANQYSQAPIFPQQPPKLSIISSIKYFCFWQKFTILPLLLSSLPRVLLSLKNKLPVFISDTPS